MVPVRHGVPSHNDGIGTTAKLTEFRGYDPIKPVEHGPPNVGMMHNQTDTNQTFHLQR